MRILLSILGGIFSAVTMSVFFGALLLAAIFLVYADDLPDHERLAQYSLPTISRIYSSEGLIIDEFARERRLFVPIDDIPDLVKNAFISAEDKNFYQHSGYDPRGMASALFDAVKSRGQNVRGASTITQQVMKNFLLSGDRTGERKIKELILATRLEQTLSKDKILELYMNEIFLGQNSYGVAAAAQTYFNKSLVDLEPHEAAMLAAMPKAPSKYHPVRAKERLMERRNYVLREMWQNGYISEATYRAEKNAPLRSVQNDDFPSFRRALPPRDYFTDEIRRQLSGSFGEDQFFSGGLSIRATLDPELQREAASALRAALEGYDRDLGAWRGTGLNLTSEQLKDSATWQEALAQIETPRDIDGWTLAAVLSAEKKGLRLGLADGAPSEEDEVFVPASDLKWITKNRKDITAGAVVYARPLFDAKTGEFLHWSLRQVPKVQGAFMAMDVNTGRVLAMQGGFSYQQSVFNRATQAFRQPGSSFKPFVYAAALDSRFSPATIVIDAPIEIDTPEGLWTPHNSSKRYYGPTTIRTGIEQSRNLMTIRVAQEVGMNTIADYAERFGVYDHMDPFLANALGSQETTLFRMVAAYAMFANGGERVEPTLVDRVQDRFGRTLYRHDDRICLDCDTPGLEAGQGVSLLSMRSRIMDPITAYQLTSMMEGVVTRGTARSIKLPFPVAGKTGTTNEARDAWFVGYSSNIVAGCYIGFDQPAPLRRVSGGGICGPVFASFMAQAAAKYGAGAFKPPEGGYFINIDRYTGGRLADTAEGENVVAEFFREGVEPEFGGFVDGGFAMGSNLPLFGEGEGIAQNIGENGIDSVGNASFGTLSSGGLY